jgi:secernin
MAAVEMKRVQRRSEPWILAFVLGFGTLAPVSACDTWVALANATASRLTILGKNSDRPQFDAQPLLFYPHSSWPEGKMIDLGRIKIPQVQETFATMGSSPYWCWGYEEGINEFGVAIGNEGQHTKPLNAAIASFKKRSEPAQGPTGMDLVRLGLERGRTAREALGVITRLLETYGQFGSGHPTDGVDGAYDNSFLIADPEEAYVLETAGTRWVAKRYALGTTSISNKLGITTAWDLASPDLVDHAVEQGWWMKRPDTPFDFETAYAGDTPKDRQGQENALTRVSCSGRLLREKAGEITIRWMMRVARDRSTKPSVDNNGTASSCVATLPASHADLPVFWWCASRPSNGCYVPYFVHGSRMPEILSRAGTFGRRIVPPDVAQRDAFSPDSYWWIAKDLSDKVEADWQTRNPIVRNEFDVLEDEFSTGLPALIKQAAALRQSGKAAEAAALLDDYSASCLRKALKKTQELRKRFDGATVASR